MYSNNDKGINREENYEQKENKIGLNKKKHPNKINVDTESEKPNMQIKELRNEKNKRVGSLLRDMNKVEEKKNDFRELTKKSEKRVKSEFKPIMNINYTKTKRNFTPTLTENESNKRVKFHFAKDIETIDEINSAKEKSSAFKPSFIREKEPEARKFIPSLTSNIIRKQTDSFHSLTGPDMRDKILKLKISEKEKQSRLRKEYNNYNKKKVSKNPDIINYNGIDTDKFEIIKESLKKVNWQDISDNWNIEVKGYKQITLDPYKTCSTQNPLYMHKEWLKWVYMNKELNLSDRKIAEICGLKNHKSLQYWRKKFDIKTKHQSGCYISNDGYIDLYMPKAYNHPELNQFANKRILRREHIVRMEDYLRNNLNPINLELNPFLIRDKNGKFYIKKECIVHHINYQKQDNHIKNLWLYKNNKEHNNNEIQTCLSKLIKLGQITFSKPHNSYKLNEDFDYRKLKYKNIEYSIQPAEFFRYDSVQLIRDEIKKIDWSDMKWSIFIRVNKHSQKNVILNPYKDSSEENPLYKHRGWVQRITHDSRFNLTDPRLAELCKISVSTAYRWRWKIHKIPADNRGFKRYLHKQQNRSVIWTKVSKTYANPFVIKKISFNYMLEHRYLLEKELANQPEKYMAYLVDGKYLKPKVEVHHINLDTIDNRIQNLQPCRDHSEHEQIHISLFALIDTLLKKNMLIFKEGRYLLNY